MTELVVPGMSQEVCVAIGNFDGVHRGHGAMLAELRQLSRRLGVAAVAVTFDRHPISVLRPGSAPPLLTTLEDRLQLLRWSGVDDVAVLPVTADLLQMTAEEFFEKLLCRQFRARGIVEGPNFHFGRNRAGDVRLLRDLCDAAGLQFQEASVVVDSGEMISSSRIRELSGQGLLRQATELLGHPYRLRGVVQHGAERGRTLGFPTANLGQIGTLIPSHGVYAGMTHIADQWYPVAVNLGPNPTFADQRDKVECHIVGYSGDLYGQQLAVDLLAELRPLRTFGSVVDLVEQIRRDVAACVECVRDSDPGVRWRTTQLIR